MQVQIALSIIVLNLCWNVILFHSSIKPLTCTELHLLNEEYFSVCWMNILEIPCKALKNCLLLYFDERFLLSSIELRV